MNPEAQRLDKYSQAASPYDQLVWSNRGRSRHEFEDELIHLARLSPSLEPLFLLNL